MVAPVEYITVAVIYRPKHQKQIVPSDPHGGVNCTPYSAAMAIDRATIGGCLVTGKYIRSHSDEPNPDPGSPGLNIGQVCDVAQAMGVDLVAEHSATFAKPLARLAENRGIVLAGDYDQMGQFSCQANFLKLHAIFVNNLNTPKTSLLVYDPLCQKYRYLPIAVIEAYAEKYAMQANGKLWYGYTRVTPNINPADQEN